MVTKQDLQSFPKDKIKNRIRDKRKHMEAATKGLDFIVAVRLHDQIPVLREKL